MATVLLNVPQILQNPTLPNGCEITSCTEVLCSLGFPADKEKMADRYLPRSTYWYGTDPNLQYMGDPHIDDDSDVAGYYCFAGPVVAAANAYLAEQGSKLRAVDHTGAEEADLVALLDAGHPVVFWASLHFADIQYQENCQPYPLADGSLHRVFHQLHCMALKGYDDDFFYIADPLDFNEKVDREQFMRIYRQLGSRAVTIE